MAREQINQLINKGTYNVLANELIPREAASDSLNWRTVEDHIEITRGKVLIGDEEIGAGRVRGEHFAYTATGKKLHLKKVGTKIQYFDEASGDWLDSITGLDPDSEVTFAPYSSLTGHYTIIGSPTSLHKIHNSFPANGLNMYRAGINYKGYVLVNEARTFLWGRIEDKTALYMSYIDKQVLTTVTGESIGAANGSLLAFTQTLDFVQGVRTAFGVLVKAFTAATVNILGITKAVNGQITANAHGLVVGDKISIAGISGMTQLNGAIATVASVVDANNFTIDIDTTAYGTWTSGGTVQRTEVFTDNKDGVLTSNKGGAGTVNYVNGAITVNFIQTPIAAQNVLVDYQWEDSNNTGITDFRYTTPIRAAGEGDVIRQDIGGDPIMNVELFEGSYFSIKQRTVYQLTLSADDKSATNKVFRANIGMPFLRASVSTSKGIMFLNTANPEKPELTIIQRNVTGDNLENINLVPQFDLAKYVWDNCSMAVFADSVLFTGKTKNAVANDRMFEYKPKQESIDTLDFRAVTFAQAEGLLYIGDSISNNVYNVLSGFDDDGFEIVNYWKGNGELFGIENLKKQKRLRIAGDITTSAKLKVYIGYEDGAFSHIGTVLGNGTYVDKGGQFLVGVNEVGSVEVGGGGSGVQASPFYLEFKVRSPKFRKRMIMLVMEGLGFVRVRKLHDYDLHVFDNKMPNKYRLKDNVSLDGATVDLNNPQ